MHVHAVEVGPGRSPAPTGHQQRDVIAHGGESAEDLVQMGLGSPRLRVLSVLPYRSAKWIASWIDTFGGMSSK